MADIFLSYSRADRPKAEQIARGLEAEGFTVWWDKILRAGQTYDEVTEGMLRDARVVIVLWSQVSVKSKWVRAEATLGERSSVLVPAMIEDADRPIMFELVQTADLIGWDGDAGEPRWTQFVADIREVLSRTPSPEIVAAASAPAPDANIEAVFWNSIDESTDPADYKAYLERYPSGHFAVLARNRLASLGASAETGAATTPSRSEASRPLAPSAPAGRARKTRPLPMLLGALAVLAGLGAVAYAMLGGPMPATGGTVAAASDAGPSDRLAAPFADCPTCPRMIVIAAGTYRRGAEPDGWAVEGNEISVGEVAVPAFALGHTEVTHGEWAACAETEACEAKSPPAGAANGEALPVSRVTWNEAVGYAEWLSVETGRAYRLPSEAEWEYAARAGTDTPFWWGDSFRSGLTAPSVPVVAASLPENPWGLAGMIGNVREWVADCYRSGYGHAPTDGSAFGEAGCQRRVLRGGAYNKAAAFHRAMNRATTSPDNRAQHIGFRVATSDLSPR